MLAFLTGVFVAGAATIAGTGAPNDTEMIDFAAAERAGLMPYWQALLPLSRGDSVERIHLVEDTLYVVTDHGTVFALTADAGLIRWGAVLAEADYTVYQPAHVRYHVTDYTIIPTTTQIQILDRYSGDIVTGLKTDFAAGSAAVGAGNWLFTGSANGNFYAITWFLDAPVPYLTQWKVRAGGPVTSTPVLYGDGKLLFTSQTGRVFSCYAVDKASDWAFGTGGAILGDSAADDAGIYVASTDRSLYKLDPASGRQLWRFRTPAPLRDGPALTSHTVYQFCPGHGLYAIDTYSGNEKWRAPSARSFVAHVRAQTALLADDGDLQLRDVETGAVQSSIGTRDGVTAAANLRDDAVYLLDRAGRVLCLRPAGVPYLRPDYVGAARARLNAPPAEASREGALTPIPTPATYPLENDPLRSRRDLYGP